MKKYEFTLTQLKALFIAGSEFEKESLEVDMGEREEDEMSALDFGDYMKENFNINV